MHNPRNRCALDLANTLVTAASGVFTKVANPSSAALHAHAHELASVHSTPTINFSLTAADSTLFSMMTELLLCRFVVGLLFGGSFKKIHTQVEW